MEKDAPRGMTLTLSDLYQEFEKGLRRYARRLTSDAASSDDLVQATFMRAMTHLGLLGGLNFYQRRAWLYQTLKRLFLDQARRRQREQKLLEQMLQVARVEAQSDRGLVLPYALIEAAPEKYRGLLYRRYVLGMTSQEIAELHGVPPATIRSRLHLALQWLRTHQSEIL